MSTTLSEQLEEYRAGWMQRVPAERRAVMERHIVHLAEDGHSQRMPRRLGIRRPPLSCRTRKEVFLMSPRSSPRGLSS